MAYIRTRLHNWNERQKKHIQICDCNNSLYHGILLLSLWWCQLGMKKFEREFGFENAELGKPNSITFSFSPNSAIWKPIYRYHFFLSTIFDGVGGFRLGRETNSYLDTHLPILIQLAYLLMCNWIALFTHKSINNWYLVKSNSTITYHVSKGMFGRL